MKRKYQLIPAILEPSFEKIVEKIELADRYFDLVQIDIIDGTFADNYTWPFESGVDIYRSKAFFDSIDINFELDLMVKNPGETIPLWLSTPAKRIIIHLDSTDSIKDCVAEVKRAKREVAIAVNINSDLERLEEVISEIDGIQCMGIEKVGFQGQKLTPKVVDLIKEIKDKYENMEVAVDGGMNKENIDLVKKAGATKFCVGSDLFNGNIDENYERLRLY